MNTVKYLKQLSSIDAKIEDKLNDIKKWEDMAVGLGSPAMSKDKVQTSRKLDKMSTAMANLVYAKDDYVKKFFELKELKKTITSQIDGMEGIYYDVLSGIYIHGLEIQEIAYKKKVCTKTISRKHKEALKEFETLYGSTYLLK